MPAVEAAYVAYREHGFTVAALSLREVARRVKLQVPSLYAYFPSKMALYDALFREGIRTYQMYRAAAVQEQGSFREWLQNCQFSG